MGATGYWERWQEHAGIRQGDRVLHRDGVMIGTAYENEDPHGDAIIVRWDHGGTSAVSPLDLYRWHRGEAR